MRGRRYLRFFDDDLIYSIDTCYCRAFNQPIHDIAIGVSKSFLTDSSENTCL